MAWEMEQAQWEHQGGQWTSRLKLAAATMSPRGWEKATLTGVPIRHKPCVDESDNLWWRVHRVLHFIDRDAVFFA